MKFTPKTIEENVNVSPTSPVKDFFELILKILGIFLALYILLGFAVDYIAPRISEKTEAQFGALFNSIYEEQKLPDSEKTVQSIVDKLLSHNPSLPRFTYQTHLIESKKINAQAFPGGHIIIYTGLLKEMRSENELAMVIAHELGHFAHRDHLRGLGRGLVFLVFSTFLSGADSSVSRFIANSMTNAEMRFSQTQESAADSFALELLNKTYSHAAGATDFFEKMSLKYPAPRFFYIFATHTYPQRRIEALKNTIKEIHYLIKEKIPLSLPHQDVH